jgi:caa(3)-type oxidase subunit IV
MSDDAHAHDHAHEGHHSASHYKKIYFILVGLAFLSFLGPEVGGALDMKWLTLLTAFGIAFVKAWLVIKHFMHLDVEKPIVHYFLLTTLAFMVLFFSAVSPDVMNHEGTNWVNVAAKAEIARALAAAEEEGHHGGHHGGGDHGGGHDADDHHHEGGDGHGDDGHHEGDDAHEGDDHHDEGDGH